MMKCFRGALIKPTTHTFLSDWSFWLIDKGPLRCGLHGKSKYLIDFFLPRPTNTIAKCTLQIWSSSMAQKPVSWYSDTVPLLLFFFLSNNSPNRARVEAFNTARDPTMNWFRFVVSYCEQISELHHPLHFKCWMKGMKTARNFPFFR